MYVMASGDAGMAADVSVAALATELAMSGLLRWLPLLLPTDDKFQVGQFLNFLWSCFVGISRCVGEQHDTMSSKRFCTVQVCGSNIAHVPEVTNRRPGSAGLEAFACLHTAFGSSLIVLSCIQILSTSMHSQTNRHIYRPFFVKIISMATESHVLRQSHGCKCVLRTTLPDKLCQKLCELRPFVT